MITKQSLLTGLFILLTVNPLQAGNPGISTQTIETVKNKMPPLTISEAGSFSTATKEYFAYYGLDSKTAKHHFGWYKSNTFKIASHVFIPENPKGTVLILHGYFDHAGIVKTLIDLCIGQGFAVATIDLPGHGMSDGERGGIEDYSQYAASIDNFILRYKAALPSPLHLMGHSTGCAAGIEYLATTKENQVDKVIFIAPLVRSYLWGPSKTAFFLVKPFIKKLPRKFKKNSGNPEYLAFVKNDPLEVRYVSARWFKALYNWNKRIVDYKKMSNSCLIIQGDKDKTVDWKYNLPFLQEKFSDLTIQVIKNGRHQLPNESMLIREKVFDGIRKFL